LIRFGFDFDNTLVNYDAPAKTWATANNLRNIDSIAKLKNYYREKGKYEIEWLKVQEWLYTEGIWEASIQEGTNKLVDHLETRGAEMFIVSHKTSVSAKSQLDLRTPARLWIDEVLRKVVDIPVKNIFFEETRDLKINRIINLQITHFVDDLIEIFEEHNYPPNIMNFLLAKNRTKVDSKNVIRIESIKDITAYV
jgi:hypothetical protein